MKVKTILVSQPEPKMENSPYARLIDKEKVKVDFRPFIHVEGVDAKSVRQQKIDLSQFTAIILTSRNAVDHYFRLAEEMRFKVPDSMKYFCQSEAVAYYLQKYVVYRKRKIYVGKMNFTDLVPLFKKYKEEKYLLPSSDVLKPTVPEALDQLQLDWKRGIFYKTVISDLSDLSDVLYDVLVFFSPSGIESLLKNFPEFKQNNTRIAVFGNSTIKAATDAGVEKSFTWYAGSVGADANTLLALGVKSTTVDGIVSASFMPDAKDLTDPYVKQFSDINTKYNKGITFDNYVLAAMNSAMLTVQALRAAGKDLTRAGVISAIENKGAKFASAGLVPLGYSPTSRIGYNGYWVSQLNAKGEGKPYGGKLVVYSTDSGAGAVEVSTFVRPTMPKNGIPTNS